MGSHPAAGRCRPHQHRRYRRDHQQTPRTPPDARHHQVAASRPGQGDAASRAEPATGKAPAASPPGRRHPARAARPRRPARPKPAAKAAKAAREGRRATAAKADSRPAAKPASPAQEPRAGAGRPVAGGAVETPLATGERAGTTHDPTPPTASPRRGRRRRGAAAPGPSTDEYEKLIGGDTHNPHGILGCAPAGRRDAPSSARCGTTRKNVTLLQEGGRRSRSSTPTAACSRPSIDGAGRRLPDPRRLRPRRGLRGRRPVPLAAHPRRDRPAPDRRGPAREPVGRPGRARPHLRHPRRPGQRHVVRGLGARAPAASGSPATSTTGPAPAPRCARSARPGVWELFVPGVGDGTRYKFQILGQDGVWREKADPMAFAVEVPPATASVVTVLEHEWNDGDWMAAAGRDRPAQRPAVHLRDPRRLLEDGPRLPGDGRRADRRPRRDRVHPRRVPAAGRPPVRAVLGLPGHLVLRAGLPLRLAGRPALPDRPAAPGRLSA